MSIITIATDFGNSDGYTAALIGVIKTIAPKSEIVIVANELESIAKASFSLTRYYAEYPASTIHLVIVDPTVGSSRRAIAGTDGKYFFVGPDNGVFSYLINNDTKIKWFEINPLKLPAREISSTFHGRDIFAPAAAFLADGNPIDSLGQPISEPVLLSITQPVYQSGEIIGDIIDVDSFGNLILNIPGVKLGKSPRIIVKNETIPFVKTFSDIPEGQPLAYIGSMGLLELAINRGRADEYFKAGSRIIVTT